MAYDVTIRTERTYRIESDSETSATREAMYLHDTGVRPRRTCQTVDVVFAGEDSGDEE